MLDPTVLVASITTGGSVLVAGLALFGVLHRSRRAPDPAADPSASDLPIVIQAMSDALAEAHQKCIRAETERDAALSALTLERAQTALWSSRAHAHGYVG